MQDQQNELEGRPEDRRRQDERAERLASEVTSLKLELATLVSAVRELQDQQPVRRRIPIPVRAPTPRPTLIPAAVVVLLATGLLSWQLISTPPPERSTARPAHVPATPIAEAEAPIPAVQTAAAMETEPPVTPLVRPTIYKGTLSVNADRPGAAVYVNRRLVGTAPVRVRNLRAGAHLVWIERAGYRRWTRVITVPAARVTRVSADLEPIAEPVIED